jgi:hypothetical protein
MKRSINTIAFVVALFLTLGVSSSFAATTTSNTTTTSNNDENQVILASFRKDFRTAELMGIETKKEYTKVTFKLNNLVLFAFYSENGDLIAVVRNILSSQLPIQLLMDLKQNHSNCWITDLFEIDSNGQTNYYVTLENGDSQVTLRSTSSNNWETYHR